MLIEKLDAVVQNEKNAVADLIALIIEVRRARLHLDLGYGSVFDLLQRRYGYAESCAARRSQVASLVEKFPDLIEVLRRSEFHLTALSVLAPVLTEENKERVLSETRGMSKFDLSFYVAKLKTTALQKKGDLSQERSENFAEKLFEVVDERTAPQRKVSAATVKVVADDVARVSFSADKDFVSLLERAKAIVGTQDVHAVLKVALKAFVTPHKPIKSTKQNNVTTRTPTRSLRNKVLARDNHQCTYERNGTRCGQRANLQIDHIQPWSLGGTTTISNLRTLCQAHNLRKAERDKLL